MTIVVTLVVTTSSYASTEKLLTPQQKLEVSGIGKAFKDRCMSKKPKAFVTNGFMEDLQDFTSDPKFCGCIENKIKNSMTHVVFTYDEKKFKAFFNNQTMNAGMECSVPIIKERFYDSCKNGLTNVYSTIPTDVSDRKIHEAGYKSADEFITKSCMCASDSMKNVSTKDWIDSSMASYNNYLERKKTNLPTEEPETPLSIALKKCLPSMQ